MKKLLLILLMLLTVGAFAQTRKKHATKKKAKSTAKHSKKRSSRHRLSGEARVEEEVEEDRSTYPFLVLDSATKKLVLKDPADEKDRPLVLINDAIYTGSLEDIKPATILDLSVIKKKGAKMIYGQKAAAGALIIKTKQPLPADLPSTLLPLPKQHGSQKPIILNEEVTYGKLEDIDPKTILKIDTLIQPKFAGAKDNDTTVNVTTKKYGTKLYQWKFGTLSKAYKTYIRSRKGKDLAVTYIMPDGNELTGEDKLQLFELASKADIKAVSFTGPGGTRKNRKPATVTIELNQPTN
ncbi:MAG: hypothetical protein V4456_03120 [Bacteroidota bacterium]